MVSNQLYLEIIYFLRRLIADAYFLRRSKEHLADFSRVRKMSFTDYMYFIIQNAKSSLQVGLNAFFEAYKQKNTEYSKQAFSKGRQRIKVEAFQELFQATVDKFYEKADLTSWNGYQLFGIDGTRLNLPCTQELAKLYGTQISQGEPQVQALVSCVYDLMNGIIIDTRFAPCKSSERVAAREMINTFNVKNIQNPVFVMDRGYPSGELLDAIINDGHKFVMRFQSKFLKTEQLQGEDTTIEHKFARLNHTLKLRVIKFQLPSGETERLVTNIFDSNISVEDFKWLYWKRWGIETKYNDVKNKIEIENFTGYSPKAILQDFYATMMLANLAGVLEYDLHDKIEAAHNKPENRYVYKMNIAMTISELKKTVVQMLVTPSWLKRERLYRKMATDLMKAVVPTRQNRSSKRVKKHKSMKYSYNLKKI